MLILKARTFPWTVVCTTIALLFLPWIQCGRTGGVTSYPSRFIVTLSPEVVPSLSAFEVHLRNLNISYKILEDYTTLVPDVFYGVSLYLEHSEDVSLIQNSSHVERLNIVKDVFPLQTFKTRILDQPLLATPETYPPHVQTNITDLHRLGILGQGIKVAIIDSGIDCAHPALGGGFGYGKRISFGIDLVGDRFNGTNDPVRGHDPCTKCGLHGTHVAGIVAAQDVGYGFTGAAPKAEIGMYRIFGCGQESQTRDDIILAALLMAYKDGADVINLSLGGSAGWGEGAVLYDVINTLVQKKNAVIIASAGNEGAEGMFMASNPASSKNAISVGSVDATSSVVHYLRMSTGQLIPYRSAIPFPTGSFPVYFTSNSTRIQDDACNPLPESTPDLSKYVVIIRRGTCYFETKVEQAQAKGAKVILFYWNSTIPVGLPNQLSNSSVAVITAEDGKHLLEASHKNNGIRLNFTHSPSFYATSPNGGFMSNFSQFGPSYDFLSPQPALSGVGGDVVSTYPLDKGGYAASSGTSMAAPQIAGVAALILSARGKNLNGLSIRSRLASTARVVRTDFGKGVLESTVHQGGGLVNAFCAVFSNTSVSTSSIALNDSTNMNRSQTFTLVNEGTQPVTYRVEHLPAGSIAAFSPKSQHGRIDSKIPTPSANYASVDIQPDTFTVMPGQKQVIRTKFTPPSGLNPEDLHVYSGYISLDSNVPCETHTVPYYGVLGSMKEQKIIDRGPNVDIDKSRDSRYHFPHFIFSDNNRSSAVEKPLIWDLKKHNHTTFLFRFNFGSPYMRLDLAPHNAVLSNSTNCTNSAWKSKFRGIDLLGLIPTSDSELFSRSGMHEVQELDWNATVLESEYSKPKRIPGGKYKVLLRALKVTGDLENEGDFDRWLSPLIHLTH
ncbi:uncharacterized protein PGTG_18576 [Puccinia graminis f. sp. tritici CRL 75-36-700-3]|uniref:Peptidase S8/S53 domain-containing protein n=1 Tax=Puccinia graminis f. sp. tritici (strain CRL 75-36-700-3 / race SCCL) TaxID=418459 RepID=E3L8C2_PUCGT|nr:uncharacterized protein PGTG_18576 [Puccinia graminis f. sp. tritici CRL 75-36-700-3]EFP92797.2 hypothetical protein PGTG_18576 [Puccinia graminis f. sp. tritici CRL 75-36-700-3]